MRNHDVYSKSVYGMSFIHTDKVCLCLSLGRFDSMSNELVVTPDRKAALSKRPLLTSHQMQVVSDSMPTTNFTSINDYTT